MTRNLAALLAGTLFGFGLCLSRMVDPAVVVAFSDIAGSWSPRLLFVMGGALMVTVPGFWLALRHLDRPLCDARFDVPTETAVDRPLLVGAAVFGVGWGLSGVCPGPAVAGLVFGRPEAGLFLFCMLVGMGAYARWSGRPGAG